MNKQLAIPATVADLLDQRRNPRNVSIIDRVESVILSIYEDPKVQKFITPIYREQTVEGNFALDDGQLALLVRDEAKRRGDPILATEKLAVIVKALNSVLRRYHLSRNERIAAYERSNGVKIAMPSPEKTTHEGDE